MNEKEYIEQRLDDQIEWYDKKSQHCQKCYKRLKIIEIVTAASIPFGMALLEIIGNKGYWDGILKIIIAMTGVTIGVIAGLLALYKVHENWLAYRTTCEMLKHEKYFYETGCGPYKDADDKLCRLVNRIEELISQENTNWQKFMNDSGKDKGNG